MSDDPELVRQVLAGDGAAFGTLLERHERVMRGIIRKTLGGSSKRERADCHSIGIQSGGGTLEALDDVWQDACLTAYLALPKFRGESSFKTWLAKIVTHKALDELRARKRRPQSLVVKQSDDDSGEDEFVEMEVWDDTGDPSLVTDAEEGAAEAVSKLPTDEYTAVPMAQPGVAAMMYLAALAWPETDDNGHKHRDDCLNAMAHLADRKGRALGLKSPNRLTMTAQQQAGVLRGMYKRLDTRLAAARVAMAVMAGFQRPNKQPWTVGAVAAGKPSRTSWHRDVWAATLPVLHLAWRFRGVSDFKRRYSKIDDDAVLDLVLDPSWVADAIAGAETLAAVLPVAKRRGDQVPFLDVPARVRLLPD